VERIGGTAKDFIGQSPNRSAGGVDHGAAYRQKRPQSRRFVASKLAENRVRAGCLQVSLARCRFTAEKTSSRPCSEQARPG
jgi:hypothetical protein